MDSTKGKLTSIDGEKARKITAKKKLDELSSGQFNVLQEMLQEIQANDSIATYGGGPKVPLTTQIEVLKQKVEATYTEDTDVRDLLLECIPSYSTVRRWVDSPTWKSAVFDKIKHKDLYENENKATVIKTVYNRAVNGDMRAAELYWKIGENFYSKESKKDTKDDVYDDLNKVLHNKK